MPVSQKLAVILHSGSLSGERADEADTLTQMHEITATLTTLGWDVEPISYDLGEAVVSRALQAFTPDIVFNLVESAFGSDAHSYRATQFLDMLGLRYTGAPTYSLRFCASKTRLKKLLVEANIATPHWAAHSPDKAPKLPAGRYIVKSETEHGSLGLDSTSVVEADAVWFTITQLANRHGGAWFAEQYVDGREFNVSLLATGGSPEVLPLAEIAFDGLPASLPKIVDYAAKWDEMSLTYRHTQRVFPSEEPDLFAKLANLSRRCWDICGLKGYARIDFRVDETGNPYVIDVNPNPCLSADAGFLAAASRAGLSPQQVMQRILDDALQSATQRKQHAALVG
jgi:D-alanine-D-alanine ligase